MKSKLIIDRNRVISRDPYEEENLPAGTVIDHPDAHQLVKLGVADPADDECLEACKGVDIELAKKNAERLRRGIHPEDFDIYEAGIMDGYDNNGKPTLGGILVPKKKITEFRKSHNEDEDEGEGEN